MRKQTINSVSETASLSAARWLDLRDLATAEITSEEVDRAHASLAEMRIA
jgi:hypothetical protein